jgi:probable phosphoglycerate mutase
VTGADPAARAAAEAARFDDVRAVLIEADGGSRGNPGPAAYGAVLKDADTGAVLAEDGSTIGVATNNVAEYRGLIAGLRLASEQAPGAAVEVRMDSKLVVEQMSGRWKVKHPDMRVLAEEARRLAPAGTTYTWVPRAENKAADLLVNEALDGKRDATGTAGAPTRGWGPAAGPPTTLVLVRHGVSDHTTRKLFSGGLGGANPPLNDEGRAQARATADWLAPLADTLDALVSSPVRRTRETAEILGERLGLEVELEPGVAEMEFGAWEGLTFAEVGERHPDELSRWLGDLDHAPGGGESFRTVERRVLEGRDRLLAAHPGSTVVVVSHVTPIKTLVAAALGAPLDALFRMELSPASVTVISYHADKDGAFRPSLRLFNARPTDAPL